MTKPIFRLALRVEGNNWTAYCAKADTMDGAIWMGSIRLSIVDTNEDRKRAFIELMRGALAEFLKSQGVLVESWNEQDAPQHERSGTA